MSDRRDDPDPDDWFDEPDTSAAWEERTARSLRAGQQREPADDWVAAAPAAPARQHGPLLERLRRPWVAAAAILVVCLIAGLAAGGVFSGGGHKAAPLLTTTAQTAPTTTAATTTGAHQTTSTPAPTVPLKPGDSGPAVKGLQRALARLGYLSSAVDGQYGPATTEAVKSFQRAQGLTADGVLGPKTRAALASALAAG
jgi:hypothetical protein